MIRQLLAARMDLAEVGGTRIVGKRWKPGVSHPWEVVSRVWLPVDFGDTMKKGAWTIILRPGFVNGIDPLMRASVGYDKNAFFNGAAVASDRASHGGAMGEVAIVGLTDKMHVDPKKREDRPLLMGPMMAVNFAGAKEWPGARPTPLKIQSYGVPAKAAAPTVTINVANEKITWDPTKERPSIVEGQRVARTVDIVLGTARQGLIEGVMMDPTAGTVTGRLVTYSNNYNSAALDLYGARPFIYQVQDYDEVAATDFAAKNVSAAQKFFGKAQTDDMIDKQHLLRLWAISPPVTKDQANGEAPVAVGADWEIELEYRTFWNLCYRTRIPVVREPPPPISFITPLGFGMANALINSWLGTQDEIMGRFIQAGVYANPEGKYWST